LHILFSGAFSLAMKYTPVRRLMMFL